MLPTEDEWLAEKPRNIPSRARGLHLGIFLPSCIRGSRTYTGQPKTNLKTGCVSPQFHYIADQKFTTVPGGLSGRKLPAITADELQLWMKTQYDSPDRDFALDGWDEKFNGPLPRAAWDENAAHIDGHLLPDPDDADRIQRARRGPTISWDPNLPGTIPTSSGLRVDIFVWWVCSPVIFLGIVVVIVGRRISGFNLANYPTHRQRRVNG